MSVWTILFIVAFVVMIASHLRGHGGHGGGRGQGGHDQGDSGHSGCGVVTDTAHTDPSLRSPHPRRSATASPQITTPRTKDRRRVIDNKGASMAYAPNDTDTDPGPRPARLQATATRTRIRARSPTRA